jgi:rsbT co-antagonist protein RsbR
MPELAQLDEAPLQHRRFRLQLQCGIGVMLLFSIISLITLASKPGLIEQLSAITDTTLTALLIGLYGLLRRVRLQMVALLLGLMILIYSILNILLFPAALIRVVIQPLLAVVVAVAYIDSRKLRGLSIAAWLTIAVLFWLSNLTLLSPEPIIDFAALFAISALTLLVLNLFHARMNETLAQTRVANAALREAQETLEMQVTDRTASLQHALGELQDRAEEQARLLAETEQQRATIRALGVPVLPISGTALAVPLVGTFDAARLYELQEQTLRAIEQSGATYLVIDITGVLTVDNEVAQGIIQVAQAVRLMGARVVLAGIRPEVAQALVSLGLDLDGLQTAATLQEGIAATTRP